VVFAAQKSCAANGVPSIHLRVENQHLVLEFNPFSEFLNLRLPPPRQIIPNMLLANWASQNCHCLLEVSTSRNVSSHCDTKIEVKSLIKRRVEPPCLRPRIVIPSTVYKLRPVGKETENVRYSSIRRWKSRPHILFRELHIENLGQAVVNIGIQIILTPFHPKSMEIETVVTSSQPVQTRCLLGGVAI
jgi:hypothetical protein